MNPEQIAGLVERLHTRTRQDMVRSLGGTFVSVINPDDDCIEAAQTITDLQAQLAEAVARAERAERRHEIEQPDTPGGFPGDIWFGHSVKRTMATHRWDGAAWAELPSEIETVLELLVNEKHKTDALTQSNKEKDERIAALEVRLKRWEPPMMMETAHSLKLKPGAGG